jgi:hypothetical protein
MKPHPFWSAKAKNRPSRPDPKSNPVSQYPDTDDELLQGKEEKNGKAV